MFKTSALELDILSSKTNTRGIQTSHCYKSYIVLKKNTILKNRTNIKTEDQFAIRKTHGDIISLGQKWVMDAAQCTPLTGC